MNVAFRVDASKRIGTGHIMRCLSLARQLSNRGARVVFVCRSLDGNLSSHIQRSGYELATLPPPNPDHPTSDWLEVSWQTDLEETRNAVLGAFSGQAHGLVIDHYAIDENWELPAHEFARSIICIDDLANRKHNCELLLDQNYIPSSPHRYDEKIPARCLKLLGPGFALLSEEYAKARENSLAKRRSAAALPIRKVLVFFGGVDKEGETLKTLEILKRPTFRELQVEIVAGKLSPHLEEIRATVSEQGSWVLRTFVPSLCPLLESADLCIGAGGTNSWERLCLGLPSIVVTIAENQVPIASNLATAGYLVYPTLSGTTVNDALADAMLQPRKYREMGIRGSELVDGLGAAKVAESILSLLQCN